MKKLTPQELIPSAPVQAALTAIAVLLGQCRDLSASITRLEGEEREAKKVQADCTRRRGEQLTKRALEVNTSAYHTYTDRLDALDAEQVTTDRNLEAITLALAASRARLAELGTRVVEMKNSPTEQQARAFSSDVEKVLQRRIDEVVTKHLLPLALEIAAMHSATNALHNWTRAFMVPHLTRHTDFLLSGERHFDGGQSVLLANAWRNDPDLVAAHDVASAPRRILEQLAYFSIRD